MTTTASSRVAGKPITIPSGVDIKIQSELISIKGSKGHMDLALHPFVKVSVDQGVLTVSTNPDREYCRTGSGARLLNSISGTVRSKINNAVTGVSKGFERKLTLIGVGYRAQMKGKSLSLTVGYSHPVELAMPEGITIETPTLTEVIVKGADRHLVGHIASKIRAVRPPEPYKGKGIRYSDEAVVRKETKKK